MFSHTASFYDIIYHWKNYRAESERLHAMIQQHKLSPGTTLLDVGCGTGKHLEHLQKWYACEGVDLDPDQLRVARERVPNVPLHHGDMEQFDLGRTFDVVVCLFGSVAYTQTVSRLNSAVTNMARHVAPGGVLVVESFLFREDFTPGKISLQTAEVPNLSIARMTVSRVEGDGAFFSFNYLVGTQAGVQHFEEAHVLGVFTQQEYADAVAAQDMQVMYDAEGLMGRGVFIGVKG